MPRAELFVELLTNTPDPGSHIAMAAKLCYSGARIEEHREKTTNADNTKFLQKLMDFGHHSPIEHVSFTFGVEGVSRALLAQLTRHRIASFSVQSQRYVKQTGSQGFSYIVPPAVEKLGKEAVGEFEAQMDTMSAWYEGWCEKLGAGESGNEDARFVLPNAAETRLLITMNARELLHFFKLRCCMRAQWEIRAMAWAMLGNCIAVLPELFDKAGASCCSGNCTEGKMTCGKAAQVKNKLLELNDFVNTNFGSPDFSRSLCEWSKNNSRI